MEQYHAPQVLFPTITIRLTKPSIQA
jgi:hypothetical protein